MQKRRRGAKLHGEHRPAFIGEPGRYAVPIVGAAHHRYPLDGPDSITFGRVHRASMMFVHYSTGGHAVPIVGVRL